MLRDLTIKNYRAFKDFSIDGLARVNLIVGKNNAGKTSFLEAVYLLINQSNPFCLLELQHNRGEFIEQSASPRVIEYPMRQIFHSGEASFNVEKANPESTINLYSTEERQISVQIEAKRANLTAFSSYRRLLGSTILVSPDVLPPFELAFLYGKHGSKPSDDADLTALPINESFAFRTSFISLEKNPGPHQFVPIRDWYFAYLGKLWDTINLTPREDAVLDALRILEPTIDRISFSSYRQSSHGILVKLRGRLSPMPLSSMGEGMVRLLALAMSAVTSENGVLLVDEIDTGIYHGAQPAMWQLMIETAQRLNVQIFATTHSWDSVEAFQEALENSADPSEGRLFRLQQRGDKIYPVDYSADELGVAVRQAIEVR